MSTLELADDLNAETLCFQLGGAVIQICPAQTTLYVIFAHPFWQHICLPLSLHLLGVGFTGAAAVRSR